MRDTDKDWEILAKQKPYYAVLTHERFLPEKFDDAARRDFFHSGAQWIDARLSIIRRRIDPGFSPGRSLDFGCGVGRLALAMAKHSKTVIGVDVAPSMIAEAQKNAKLAGIENVNFQAALPESPMDWINSAFVMQHIPPERGYELISQMLSILAPGGVISLHITVFREARLLALSGNGLVQANGSDIELFDTSSKSPAGTMMMYDYDLGRVLSVFTLNRVEHVWLQHTDHAGIHAYTICGSKL